jgi:hypothetical protein
VSYWNSRSNSRKLKKHSSRHSNLTPIMLKQKMEGRDAQNLLFNNSQLLLKLDWSFCITKDLNEDKLYPLPHLDPRWIYPYVKEILF